LVVSKFKLFSLFFSISTNFIFFKIHFRGVFPAFSRAQEGPKHPQNTFRGSRSLDQRVDPGWISKILFFGVEKRMIRASAMQGPGSEDINALRDPQKALTARQSSG